MVKRIKQHNSVDTMRRGYCGEVWRTGSDLLGGSFILPDVAMASAGRVFYFYVCYFSKCI